LTTLVSHPSSSPAQQARASLGARLREIRVDSGLSGRDLARRTGWHESKVSRIEHARQAPSSDEIRMWCEHCGAPEQIPDLVESLRIVEGMWVEWRRLERTGMRRQQESHVPLYKRTRQFRIYEAGIVPGLFQTKAYATSTMAKIIEFSGIPDDLEDAVAARVARQRVVYSKDHRFGVVLEEAALHARIGSVEMMVEQLRHLIEIATLPNVSLGIIPPDIDRRMWASPGFWIFDDTQVLVETPTAELTITQPREISVYLRTFAEYAAMAVYGAAARSLITAALEGFVDR
jgi:transcriptional regulator with XRE-family HTH domain